MAYFGCSESEPAEYGMPGTHNQKRSQFITSTTKTWKPVLNIHCNTTGSCVRKSKSSPKYIYIFFEKLRF